LIISFANRHTPFRGQKINMRRRYHTEAKSFSLLTQPSVFIFCLRPLARRWPGPSGKLQATGVITQKRIVHRPWIFIHSYHYIIGIYRLV